VSALRDVTCISRDDTCLDLLSVSLTEQQNKRGLVSTSLEIRLVSLGNIGCQILYRGGSN
jgi:hypothetical protein